MAKCHWRCQANTQSRMRRWHAAWAKEHFQVPSPFHKICCKHLHHLHHQQKMIADLFKTDCPPLQLPLLIVENFEGRPECLLEMETEGSQVTCAIAHAIRPDMKVGFSRRDNRTGLILSLAIIDVLNNAIPSPPCCNRLVLVSSSSHSLPWAPVSTWSCTPSSSDFRFRKLVVNTERNLTTWENAMAIAAKGKKVECADSVGNNGVSAEQLSPFRVSPCSVFPLWLKPWLRHSRWTPPLNTFCFSYFQLLLHMNMSIFPALLALQRCSCRLLICKPPPANCNYNCLATEMSVRNLWKNTWCWQSGKHSANFTAPSAMWWQSVMENCPELSYLASSLQYRRSRKKLNTLVGGSNLNTNQRECHGVSVLLKKNLQSMYGHYHHHHSWWWVQTITSSAEGLRVSLCQLCVGWPELRVPNLLTSMVASDFLARSL